jgi:hypothetical protein
LSALSPLLKLNLSSGAGSLQATSKSGSTPLGPFLGVSRSSPGNMRAWLWEPKQNNPALLMSEDLVSGKWQSIPAAWVKSLGGGLFEVDVPIHAGSAFLRLESTESRAPAQ